MCQSFPVGGSSDAGCRCQQCSNFLIKFKIVHYQQFRTRFLEVRVGAFGGILQTLCICPCLHHPEDIRLPHAKFSPGLLKIVVVYKVLRNGQTQIHFYIHALRCGINVYEIYCKWTGMRQMRQKLQQVDCVVEVHDARISFWYLCGHPRYLWFALR